MPEAPNTSYDVAYQAASRESLERTHLQGILANARAGREQEAQLKAKQEEMYVDPSAFTNGAGAEFADGADPVTNKLRFKNAASLSHAIAQDKIKGADKADLDGYEQIAKQAALKGDMMPNHPAFTSFQRAAGRQKLNPLERKHLEDYRQGDKIVSKDAKLVSTHGDVVVDNKRVTVPPPPVAPGHRRTTTHKDDGTSTYTDVEHTPAERAVVGSMKEDGWTEDHPRYQTEFANRYNKMMPVQDGVKMESRSTGFNLPSAYGPTPAPAGAPPAAVPPPGAPPAAPDPASDTLNKTIAAAQQALQDPNIPADKKQAIQAMLAKALQLKASNGGASAAAAPAVAPAVAPAAPAPGAPVPGAGPKTVVGNPKPLDAQTTTAVTGMARLTQATGRIGEIVDDPKRWEEASKYIGPAASYKATVQRWTPENIATKTGIGETPDDVLTVKQDLATLRNYIIKLITGAQMSEYEGKRIMKELPDESLPAYQFKKYFASTRRDIKLMEETMKASVLRGDKRGEKLQAIFDELGFTTAQKAAGPTAAPPKSTGAKIKILRNGEPGEISEQFFNPKTDTRR